VAEHINGIIKQEYSVMGQVGTIEEAREELDKAVALYNGGPPHSSISMLAPDRVHSSSIPVARNWKNYHRKRPSVNPGQNEPQTVNLPSDIHPKL